MTTPDPTQPADPYNVLPDLNRVFADAGKWDASKDRDAAVSAIDLIDAVANRLLLVRARIGEEIWHHERDHMYAADRTRR